MANGLTHIQRQIIRKTRSSGQVLMLNRGGVRTAQCAGVNEPVLVPKKDEVLSLVNTYFKANPCRSEKKVRLSMVNKFYELRALHAHKATPGSVLGKV